MKKKLFIIIFCLLTTKVFAQNLRLSGKVQAAHTNEAIGYAAVLLTEQADSTKRSGALTSVNGEFSLKDLKNGKYILKISALGYKTLAKPIEITTANLDLGTLKMEEDALALKEVSVTGQQANVKIKPDTIEYNATAFKTQPNAAVEELLKKLPGVEIDRDGNILVQGQKVTRLTVDGKDFFGTDPKTATKNLPADAIAKVQVVDSKTLEAKATGIDDGQREKVLNLTIKEDKKRGWFGNANLYGGTTDKYNSYLSANHFNKNLQFALLGMSNNVTNASFQFEDLNSFTGGNIGNIFAPPAGGSFSINVNNGRTTIGGSGVFDNSAIGEVTTHSGGVNYSNSWGANNKLAISSSYFTYFSKGIGNRLSNIQDFNQNDVLRTEENSIRNSDNQAHRFNFKAEYHPDSLTDITFRPNIILNYSRNINDRNFNSKFDNAGKSNDGNQYFNQKNVTPSLFGEFVALRRLKNGSVSLRLNGTQNTYNSNWLNQSLINKYENGATIIEKINQQAEQENLAKTYTVGLNYMRQLNKKWSANVGYQYNQSNIDAEQLTLDYNNLTDRYEVVVPNFSNRIDNKNWSQSARFGFIHTRTQWTYNFGFGLQETGLDAATFTSMGVNTNNLDRKYYNILPRLSINFKNKANHTIQLNYNSNVNLPSVNDLQPVQNNNNPLYQRVGNPDLEATKNHRMAINFNTFSADNNRYWNGYFLVNYAIDDIGNSVKFTNGVQNVQPVNVDGNYFIRTGTFFGQPTKIKGLRMGYGLNLFMSHTSSFINDEKNATNRYSAGPSTNFSYDIDDKLNVGIYLGVQYSKVNNSQPAAIDNKYFSFYNNATVSWEFVKNMRITTELQHNGTAGRADGFNNNVFLLNVGLEQYMMKRRITLAIKGFDVLNQNTNIDRLVNASRMEDIRYNTINRYFYMSLNYKISKAGATNTRSNPRNTVG
ncbi:TonB-dependent receptor [Pedobacter xixiisoli]|uniref:Outer membrane receptor proteins, mostly Fe transport n=1 Tax=Pedobacter xixiisoli TaxID=1476464 RepID=A0A286A8S1_9SPHI|nr:TonB-dependent receptor [Pedobacter xixiisoli]SOD18316.1 Outer membrane receptor proteins, mostly Fe transport [Pedobacter xixiisoli]